jgi:hypothetical protein
VDHKDSMGGCGWDSFSSVKGPVASSFEQSNELSDSMKSEFLD